MEATNTGMNLSQLFRSFIPEDNTVRVGKFLNYAGTYFDNSF
jgi:hypothetical protein